MRNGPRPLPPGVFPRLLAEAGQAGFSRSALLDVLDEWLNFGYCRIIDPITDDIELLPAGVSFFSKL